MKKLLLLTLISAPLLSMQNDGIISQRNEPKPRQFKPSLIATPTSPMICDRPGSQLMGFLAVMAVQEGAKYAYKRYYATDVKQDTKQ